jgi:hypothetical protein
MGGTTGLLAALALAAPAAADYVKVNEPTGTVMGANGGVVLGAANGDRAVEGGLCNDKDGAFGAFPAYYYLYASPTAPPGAAGYTPDGAADCSGDAPRVATGFPAEVTATSAKLTGTLHGKGLETTYFFEWAAAEGAVTRAGEAKVSDWASHRVTATLDGLAPATTYRVALIATNASGESRGAIKEFTTCPAEGCTEETS